MFCIPLPVQGNVLDNNPQMNRREYVKSIATIGIIVIAILSFFFGLSVALNTEVPIRVVESGSMCVPHGGRCDGWSDIFEQTLHVGDIIIIQGVDAEEISADYPNSDIIVYLNPTNPAATPIVHRVVAKYQQNGTWYFQTKGDGNGHPWPAPVSTGEYDSNSIWQTGQGVPEGLVLGKVVLRIPMFGHITLFLRSNSWGLPLIVAVILILLIVEFVIPMLRTEKKKVAAGSDGGKR